MFMRGSRMMRIYEERLKLRKRGGFYFRVTGKNRRGEGFGFEVRGEVFGGVSVRERR